MKTAAQGLVDMQIEVGRELLFNTERQKLMQDLVKEDPELWGKIREAAERLGLTLGDVGDAIFGGEERMDALKEKLQQTVGESDALGSSAVQYGQKLTPAAAAAAEILGYLSGQEGEIEKAQTALENYNSVLGESAANASELKRQLAFARENAAALGGSRPFVGVGQVGIV
jgi:chromosome segregation ATPase